MQANLTLRADESFPPPLRLDAHGHAPGINWMKHLAKLKVDYYLVGATDQKTAAVSRDWKRAGMQDLQAVRARGPAGGARKGYGHT